MSVLSAKDLRNRDNPQWALDIGGGDEVFVRRPDLQTLIFEGIMPTLLVSAMVKTIASWAGASNVTVDMLAQSDDMRTFVNTWVCAATITPKVVMPPKEGATVPDDVVVVSDLTLATRSVIFNATFFAGTKKYTEVAAQAERFPELGHGETAGQDVPEIQPTSEPDFIYG